MDPEKGAKFEVKASEPTLTTSATKPGLTYTLREGATLDGSASSLRCRKDYRRRVAYSPIR